MVISIAPSQNANRTFSLWQLCSEMVVALVSWLNHQRTLRTLKPASSLFESIFAINILVFLKVANFAVLMTTFAVFDTYLLRFAAQMQVLSLVEIFYFELCINQLNLSS